MKTKVKLSIVFSAILLLCWLVLFPIWGPNTTQKSVNASIDYSKDNFVYYDQLTPTAKGIYDILAKMRDSGELKTGTKTVDLIEEGVFENREYTQERIMAEFGAARDAFDFDNADLFYVDLSKISIRATSKNNKYTISMGIGREANYFAEGININNIEEAISDYNAAISLITSNISSAQSYSEKVRDAYEATMETTVYKLEKDAGADRDFVRTTYGAVVKNKAVCEGYARTFKAICDRLNIPCVLVQGVYIIEDSISGAKTPREHMWNYVKMNDGKWYLCDTTMEDDNTSGGSDYYLKNGTELVEFYQADTVLSEAQIDFRYPTLSLTSYSPVSDAISVKAITTDTEDYDLVSYLGKGIAAAKADGKYFLYRFYDEGALIGNWGYVELFIEQLLALMQNGSTLEDVDTPSGFKDSVFGNLAHCFAMTEVAPPTGKEITAPNYMVYEGEENQIEDITRIYGVEWEKSAPMPAKVSTNTSRLLVGKTYDIVVEFTEDMELPANVQTILPTLFTSVNPNGEANLSSVISDVEWAEDNVFNKVKFKFTPRTEYAYDACNYYIGFENLKGVESEKTPDPIMLYAVNQPHFACPRIPNDSNIVYASQPQLIANSDLSLEGWKYSDNTSVDATLPARLALTATKYSSDDEAEAKLELEADEVTNGVNILQTATFDLSLHLCRAQIDYLGGKKVKVLVPFPEGYTATTAGVHFKAYHFKKDNTIEEIDCYTNKNGIVMLCDAFSPYTIAVCEGVVSTKSILVNVDGYGSVSGDEITTLSSGENASFIVTAREGYIIDSVKVNGEALGVSNNTETTLNLNYADLDSANTTVEVVFVSKAALTALGSPNEGNVAPWIIALVCVLAGIILACVVYILCTVRKSKK